MKPDKPWLDIQSEEKWKIIFQMNVDSLGGITIERYNSFRYDRVAEIEDAMGRCLEARETFSSKLMLEGVRLLRKIEFCNIEFKL